MLAYLFLVFAIATRFLPHPFSFTPVGAALLYFGARGSRKQMWIPVAAFFASDIILNKFVYALPFTPDQLFSVVWYAAIIGFGMLLSKHTNPMRLVGASMASAVSFFLISNFGVWLGQGMYPMTLGGLRQCFVAGVPFFRHDLIGNLLFTAVFFGLPMISAAVAGAFENSNGVKPA